MEILTPDELKEKYTDAWITPYHEILTVTDNNEDKIELIEYHPCPVGSDWMITQYQRTSPLILEAKRDGNKQRKNNFGFKTKFLCSRNRRSYN